MFYNNPDTNNRLQGERWLNSSRKRTFDLAFGLAVTPVLTPAAKIGAAAFARETGLDPVFRQHRMSNDTTSTVVTKLRTMAFDGDYGDRSNGDRDPRATRVGRGLRLLKVDEAPMMRAVLEGRMSTVGPRPLVAEDVEQTLELLSESERNDWARSRTVALPGLVSAFNMRSRHMDPQSDEYLLSRVAADITYLEQADLELDLRIISDAFKGVVQEVGRAI